VLVLKNIVLDQSEITFLAPIKFRWFFHRKRR